MTLKLIAWSDRGRETVKDASDIYHLLTAYADARNTDRLYENELDLADEASDFWQTGINRSDPTGHRGSRAALFG
jgi:predicted nucleotidyltransferase